jgi:hypothetical protein
VVVGGVRWRQGPDTAEVALVLLAAGGIRRGNLWVGIVAGGLVVHNTSCVHVTGRSRVIKSVGVLKVFLECNAGPWVVAEDCLSVCGCNRFERIGLVMMYR